MSFHSLAILYLQMDSLSLKQTSELMKCDW